MNKITARNGGDATEDAAVMLREKKSVRKGLFFLAIFIGAAYAASMNVWTCRKCQLTVKSEKRPQTGTCPEKGGHFWTLMAEAGDENWQCKKCAKVLYTNGRPQTGFCPKGGGHHWQKL